MANNKILGKYLLEYNDFDYYELTGNSYRGEKVINSAYPDPNILNYGDETQDPLTPFFIKENIIHIKKIRVLSKGAFGLRSVGSAAKFQIFCNNNDPDLNENGPVITIENWNEWQDIDVRVLNTKKTSSKIFSFGFKNLDFEIEDFNIQPVYVGLNVYPVLQMWIETAGLWYGYNEQDGKVI